MRASWQRLDDGSWGVKLAGDLGQTGGMAGREVLVESRDGRQATVTLGQRVDSWNGGRASVYEVASAPDRRTSQSNRQTAGRRVRRRG